MAEVEERECRICRGEDEPNRPLFHPCKCSGSIKYTHEDCLVNWLAQSGSTRCELCNHPFRFEPLYQPDTPSALPTREFLLGVLTLTKKALKTAARIALVFTVWLFLLPVGTCWIWYALFINSLSQLPKLLASRGPAGVVSDAFYGFLLSAGIVFIFLGVSSLREYIRHFPPDNADGNEQHDHHNIDFLIDEDVIMPDDADHFTDEDEDLEVDGMAEADLNAQQIDNANLVAFEERAARIDGPIDGMGHNEGDHEAFLDHDGGGGIVHPMDGPFPRHMLHPHPNALHNNPNIFQQAREARAAQDDARTEDSDEDIDDEVLNEVDELVRDTIDEFAGGDNSDVEVVENDAMLAEDSDEEEPGFLTPPAIPHIHHQLHHHRLPHRLQHHRDGFDELEDDNLPEHRIADDDVFMADGMEQYVEQDDDRLSDEDDDVDDDDDDDEFHDVHPNGEERMEGGPLFGLFDLDPDEVPLEEVVGLRGPIRNLFDNAGTVLVSNAVFLCVFTLIPLLIGRVILRLFSMHSFPVRIAMAFPSTMAAAAYVAKDHDSSFSLSARLVSLSQLSLVEVPAFIVDSAKNVSLTWLATRLSGAVGNGSAIDSTGNTTKFLSIFSPSSASFSPSDSLINSSPLPDLPAAGNASITTDLFSSPLSLPSSLSPSSSFLLTPSTSLAQSPALSVALVATKSITSPASPSTPAVAEQPIVSYVDNLPIVLLGYGMVALMAVAYIGVMSMLRRRYPRLDSPVTRQIARMLRYIATFVKIIVLIVFEFGIFPLGCGWWLDICTLDILGISLQTRLAYCSESPWMCSGVHWLLGIFYMVHISLFISLLRDVVKPQLLWFLRNPDDPEFHPFRELVEKPLSRHARRMCLSVIIYVPLIVAVVYVPGQLCLKLLPSVFPFRSEDFSHILIDVPFGNLLIGPLIRLLYYGRPEVSLQNIVAAWIRWTSRILGIEDVVVKDENDVAVRDLPDEEDAARREREEILLANRLIAQQVNGEGGWIGENGEQVEVVDGIDEIDDMYIEDIDAFMDDMMAVERRWVRIRGAIMIVLGWLTLICVESALIAVPTIIGRWLMGVVGLAVRHDLHPYLLGLNIVLLSVSGMLKAGKYMMGTLGTGTLWTVGMPYVIMGLKGGTIMTVWLGMIPLATGLLFEMIVMPIRVAHNETAYFCMHQDWALGLLLLKVWACIAMTGGLGARWRERVMRARQADLAGMDQHFRRSMTEVVLPVLICVVTALAVPYSFARSVLPLLGASQWVCNLVYRYAYLVSACVYVVVETMRYSMAVLGDLHDSIRDDKYLIGKRLYNFGDSQQATPTAVSGPSHVS